MKIMISGQNWKESKRIHYFCLFCVSTKKHENFATFVDNCFYLYFVLRLKEHLDNQLAIFFFRKIVTCWKIQPLLN